MKDTHVTYFRRMAIRLASHAANILPRNCSAWAEAMTCELQYIPDDAAAFKWACGCVLASYYERIRNMTHTARSIPRWVLLLEMLVCFTPLTLLFLTICANFALFQGPEDFLRLSVTALGPLGSIVAFKTVVLSRPSLPEPASRLLCMLAIWTPVAYTAQLLLEHGTLVDWWRELILIALFPAMAAVHLILLARPRSHAGVITPAP
jgi:hypothetical protein